MPRPQKRISLKFGFNSFQVTFALSFNFGFVLLSGFGEKLKKKK